MISQSTIHAFLTSHPACRASWLVVALCAAGCTPDSPSEGLSPDVKRIVSDDILSEIEATGQVIHRGSAPPNIEGTFDVNPFVLQASNFPDTNRPGFQFNPMFITFSNQDTNALSVRVDYAQGTESGAGAGSFIAGSGAGFSVFAPMRVISDGQSADVVQVFSGEIDGRGIRDFQFANFMIDDHGDLANMLLDVGQGRVIHDADGVSPRE
jgi:hypothetical protein